MATIGAVRAQRGSLAELAQHHGVVSRRELIQRFDISRDQIQANLDAARWRRLGLAIVLRPGPSASNNATKWRGSTVAHTRC